MVSPNFIFMQAMNSSLWIAVLVVHVSCIIEAQPSKSQPSSSLPSASLINEKRSHFSTFELVPAASISASYSSRQNPYGRSNLVQRPYNRGRKFTASTPTTNMPSSSPSSTTEAYDDDSCSGKLDGYYQNFGSDCTSYYFCAAGYQITYVCPQGEKFNGKNCDEEYKCPVKKGHVNLCADVPNGYYSNTKSPGKYFYCFQRAKVIDLQCDPGKVFIEGKCTFPQANSNTNSQAKNEPDNGSCVMKSNGFYPDKRNCRKYFYCINGDKTELSCQSGFLFNGDICVHNSRFTCPYLQPSTTTATQSTLSTSESSESRGRGLSNRVSKGDLDLSSTSNRSTTTEMKTTTDSHNIKEG